jgi:hypothetical protein
MNNPYLLRQLGFILLLVPLFLVALWLTAASGERARAEVERRADLAPANTDAAVANDNRDHRGAQPCEELSAGERMNPALTKSIATP